MEMVDVLHVHLDSTRLNLEIPTVHNVAQILTPMVKLEAQTAVSLSVEIFFWSALLKLKSLDVFFV